MSKDLGNYDAQSELLSALKNDTDLSALAKGGFHNLVAKQDSKFPRIVYSELINTPTKHADNDETQATVNFQVSIFSDDETVADENLMVKAVDRIMRSLNYRKYDSQSLYEKDTKLYHKPLRYEKKFN